MDKIICPCYDDFLGNPYPHPMLLEGTAMYTDTAISTDSAVSADLDTLHALNGDYIRSVQMGDVRRFDEILADDFLCSNPDGTLIDRSAFLQHTAPPVTIPNL